MKKSLLLSVVLFCTLSFAFGQKKNYATVEQKTVAPAITLEQKLAMLKAAQKDKKSSPKKVETTQKVVYDTRFSKATSEDKTSSKQQ